jgi:hypothetical protein
MNEDENRATPKQLPQQLYLDPPGPVQDLKDLMDYQLESQVDRP